MCEKSNRALIINELHKDKSIRATVVNLIMNTEAKFKQLYELRILPNGVPQCYYSIMMRPSFFVVMFVNRERLRGI